MKSVDLRGRKSITARDIEIAGKAGATEVIIGTRTGLKADARDMLEKHAIALKFSNEDPASTASKAIESCSKDLRIERLFNSPEAQSIKEEICSVGRKLWLRSFVDGNGGNISCRIGDNEVLCTPTLLSKFDLTPEDVCMVDLEGNQLAGKQRRTSEVYLHLEVYKSVPQAKAVVHCHPPHATAYAISGHVPPTAVIPEFDVFVGSVALTQYETPGTIAFAETVRPYVQNHNTILLGNHGIVCWADTPIHAEWYAENLETYCWTLLISKQLGIQYSRIPFSKEQDLLAIKQRLGLPDARFDRKDSDAVAAQENPRSIALLPENGGQPGSSCARTATDADIEAIADAVTKRVLEALKRG